MKYLQLFAFLWKSTHMTSQECCTLAQQAPYLFCLQWEKESTFTKAE